MSYYFFKLVKASIFLLVFVCSTVYPQQLPTVKESKGYRFFNRIQMGYTFIPNTGYALERDWKNDQIISEKAKKFSYGKGFNMGYSGGIWVNKNMGIELGFSYLIGGRNKISHSYDVDTVAYPYYNQQNIEEKVNMFRFGPGVVFQTDMGRVSGYGRLNVWYGLGNGLWDIEENVRYYNGHTSRGSFEWEVKGLRASGFASALGIKIKSEDELADVFIEFSYVGMGGTFQKASRTMYIIDGNNFLSNLSVSERELIYVDEIDYTDKQEADEPTKVLKSWQSFSGYGINVGLLINIK